MHIADGIGATPRSEYGREAHENRSLLALGVEEAGGGDVAKVAVADEFAVGTGASGVDSAFGNLPEKKKKSESCQRKWSP